jgi:hypothetical protein
MPIIEQEQNTGLEYSRMSQQQALLNSVMAYFSEVQSPLYLQMWRALATRGSRWNAILRGFCGADRRSGWEAYLSSILSDPNPSLSDWHVVGKDILAAMNSYALEHDCIENAETRAKKPARR